MSNGNATVNHIYTAAGQRQLLVSILTAGITLPVLFSSYLSPIIVLAPVVVIGGTILVRRDAPDFAPTWVVFNCVSFFIIVYAAYTIGTTLTLPVLVVFLVALLGYDIIGVETGAMQSMNQTMLTASVPIMLLLPHSPEFSYSSFREIIRRDGLEGLHGSKHGVMMLGIGDAVLPAALAIGCRSLGTVHQLGVVSVTVPQVSVVLGGVVGLGILIWAELPRAIAALTVSVPGALLGLVLGVLVDPTAGFSWVGI